MIVSNSFTTRQESNWNKNIESNDVAVINPFIIGLDSCSSWLEAPPKLVSSKLQDRAGSIVSILYTPHSLKNDDDDDDDDHNHHHHHHNSNNNNNNNNNDTNNNNNNIIIIIMMMMMNLDWRWGLPTRNQRYAKLLERRWLRQRQSNCWDQIMKNNCWRQYVTKHGRKGANSKME